MGEPDPFDMLRESEPGTVLYAFAEGDNPHLEFLVRERSEEILLTGDRVELRAGVVTEFGIPVPMVLFRFPPPERIYRTFWNYHAPAGKVLFNWLGLGPAECVMKWMGDSGRVEKYFVLTLPLAGFFKKAAQQAASAPEWDEDQFFGALDALDENSGGLRMLWRSLGGL